MTLLPMRIHVLLSCVTFALAQTQFAVPANSTNWVASSAGNSVVLALHGIPSSINLVPLTNVAVTSLPHGSSDDTGLSGQLIDGNSTAAMADYMNPSKIAFTSCDPQSYPGNINLSTVIGNLVTSNVTAIILYSFQSSHCNLTDFSGTYQYLYSMTSQQDSTMVETDISQTANQGKSPPQASIMTMTAFNNANINQNNALNGAPSTAVAMIILYSITGLITALFLVIIVAGAIRAHRHPERYGPRQVLGRARQSRARGIARAMLDTLPIVKFGEKESEKGTRDVELAAAGSSQEIRSLQTPDRATQLHEKPSTSMERERAEASSFGNEVAPLVAAAAAPSSEEAKADNALGCSICTDDFEHGQDIRVLPCNHKFHPACVDPWLLDVSGTCPLCRVDLHPTTSRTNSSDSPLPPPLNTSPGTFRRRDALRNLFTPRAMQSANPDERIAALRRFRMQNRNQIAPESATTEAEEPRLIQQSRLRSIFTPRAR